MDNRQKLTNLRETVFKKFTRLYCRLFVTSSRCIPTWTLTSRNEQQLRIFERKILRKIFGPVQNENGIWRIRKNHELNELIGNADIVRFIKKQKNGLSRTRDADGWRENA